MKRCPSCQQSYPDDSPDYCANDGMRLVSDETAAYDPGADAVSSGSPSIEPESQAPTSSTPWEPRYQELPPISPKISQPTNASGPQPSEQWQPQAGRQQAQASQAQFMGSPAPLDRSFQQGYAGAPRGAAYTSTQRERTRSLSIAALVFGAGAATIVTLTIARNPNFVYTMLLVLSLLGIAFGVTALILILRNPNRFAGAEIAIGGLSLGVAGLVYYFLNP